jgi:hypothetical protein
MLLKYLCPIYFNLLFWLYVLKGDITDLAVSSNNALVASASNDFVIRVVGVLYLIF